MGVLILRINILNVFGDAGCKEPDAGLYKKPGATTKHDKKRLMFRASAVEHQAEHETYAEEFDGDDRSRIRAPFAVDGPQGNAQDLNIAAQQHKKSRT